MKVVVCKDEDAEALLLKMKVAQNDLVARFSQQSQEQAHVVSECFRRVHYDLVTWLQAQGFKTT